MELLRSGVAFQLASNADTSPGANDIPRRWSMFTQSGVVAGCSRRLSAAYASADDRPRVRVGGCFAGEVPGIELCEGGVEVVEVERDMRRQSARRRQSR